MQIKHKIYITSGIFLGIIALLLIGVIFPLWQNIKKSSGDISSEKNDIIFLEAQNESLDEFNKKYQDFEPNFKKADAMFVDVKNPVDFIEFIEAAAANSGVRTEINLVNNQEDTMQYWPTEVFSVAAEGDFPNILLFSEKLETGPYLLQIQKVTVRKAGGNEEDEEANIDNGVESMFFIEVASNEAI